MDSAKCRRILDENLLDSVMNLKPVRRFTFQQDSDKPGIGLVVRVAGLGSSGPEFEPLGC